MNRRGAPAERRLAVTAFILMLVSLTVSPWNQDHKLAMAASIAGHAAESA